MSLPPGFLDELRERIPLSQVVGRKVTWDRRRSNPGKGDMWAPCPFHQEKTASFHVDDRKGFYYCFGCHAKGDALSFVQETENVGFMEAVEILAREAGMAMPARDPEARVRHDHRDQLRAVMEEAVRFFRLRLRMAEGAAARQYLEGRRLAEAALERFEIGYAPAASQALWSHLRDKGVAPELILATGLAAEPDDGRAPYDRFRDRIMFPIRDARGRAIAFGGRAMDPNARAKYLNSPETELFDKGRTLYNFGPAREAAGKGAPLVVVEGYMDVIALVEAGFGAAVAPLGTAITADQLGLMWRAHPEPVIALDGDAAGIRAAMRLVDLALPLLAPGRSLRFCLLPAGLDPDDLVRGQGAGAMRRLVESAEPLVSLLWRRETEGRVFDSPERRAALDKALREAIRRIPDQSVRRHYAQEIKTRRDALFAPRRAAAAGPGYRRGAGQRRPLSPAPTTRGSVLGQGAAVPESLREAVILAILVTHPTLVARFEPDLERLEFLNRDHARIRDALLRHADATDIRAEVTAEVGAETLENLFASRHVQIAPAVRDAADHEKAELALAEEIAKLAASRGAEREIEEAVEDLAHVDDEGLTWRLRQASEARLRAQRLGRVAADDIGEDRDALSRQLQALIEAEVWKKGKR